MSNTQFFIRCKNIPPYVPLNRHRYIPILAETTSFSIFNCVICYNRDLERRKVEQARLIFQCVAALLHLEPVIGACKTSISLIKSPTPKPFCYSSLCRLSGDVIPTHVSPDPGFAERFPPLAHQFSWVGLEGFILQIEIN